MRRGGGSSAFEQVKVVKEGWLLISTVPGVGPGCLLPASRLHPSHGTDATDSVTATTGQDNYYRHGALQIHILYIWSPEYYCKDNSLA